MLKWFKKMFASDDAGADLRRTGSHTVPMQHGPRGAAKKMAAPKVPETIEYSSDIGGRIDDGGTGKNVLIRNRVIREDTGTHETMLLVDDSILGTDEEDGFDPYNTGRFDRARKWDGRTRK